ncbi:MAG: filamentous hemagglutinin N-terminal domain-containing protein [Parvibaculaceae bacterium]
MPHRPSDMFSRKSLRAVLAGGAIAVALAGTGSAEPTGGVLVDNSALVRGGGDPAAVFNSVSNGPGTDVSITQNAERVFIDWTSFDIGASDTVTFDQLASNWIAVNRVTGGLGSPTQIDGMLSATGHVWIINPAGIAFGSGATVDVGGLLATTSSLDPAAFAAADPAADSFTFSAGGTGSVTNAATLEATGLIALVAPVVENSGTLRSANGDVLLGGAQAFRLRFAESDRTPVGGGATYQELLVTDFIVDTGVDLNPAPGQETVPVNQTAAGRIEAGNVIVSAASVGGGAFLNLDGVVEASNVGVSSGNVTLLGGVDLTGGVVGTGGTETIRLTDLGVNGAGDFTAQGSDVSVGATAQTFSAGSVSLTAVTGDATVDNDLTATTGAVSVTAATGNVDVAALTAGTSVTVSGQDIDLAGKVTAGTAASLTATAGHISSTGAVEVEGGTGVTLTGPVNAGTSATVTATTGDATVNNDLAATTGSVSVTAANGNVDVAALTAGTSVTVSGQDIDLAGKVTAGTTASLTATAGNISSTGAVEVEGGTGVTLTGPVNAGTSATVTATTGDATVNNDVTATAGAISVTAANGNVDVATLTAGTSVTVSGQDIDLAGKVTAGTTAGLTATAGDISSAGAVEVEGDTGVTLTGPVNAGTSATVTATTGDATVNNDLIATTGAISVTAANGNVDVAALTAGTSVTVSGQDIDLAGKVTAGTTAGLTATAGDISSAGAVEVEGGTGVTLTGPVNAGTSATVTATTGDATVNNELTATTGAVSVTAANGNVDVAALTAGTSVTVSGQDIDLAGKVTAGTTASLTATAGDISSAGNLEIEAGSITLIGTVRSAGDVILNALTGGISVANKIFALAGNVSMDAINGTISVDDIETNGNIRLVGGALDILGTVVAQGTGFLQALSGNVTVHESVTVAGGALVLDAANGDAVLNRIAAQSDIFLTVTDLDLSGSLSAGDELMLLSGRIGETIVLGGDGTTGGASVRRPVRLTIDESELQRFSVGRFEVDAGANDVLLLDAALGGGALSSVRIGTDQTSRIVAAGRVSGLTSLELGYQTSVLDRRPELILVSGELGQDTSAGRLGTVRLESAGDIVIGTEEFLDLWERQGFLLNLLAPPPLGTLNATPGHIFIAADTLNLSAPGAIVQLNTGSGVDGAGIVAGAPATGEGILFPSGAGPTQVALFGEIIRADGTRVSSFNAGLEANILYGGDPAAGTPGLVQNGDYYWNICLIGDPVSCSSDALREAERTNRFINNDPSGLGGVIPVVFETGEDKENDEEEDLGGVAASGNEALWDAGAR